MNDLPVIIAGGGIGGLATPLARKDFVSIVLERTDKPGVGPLLPGDICLVEDVI